ncbi:MAG: hypothetical protein O7G87_19970 [bacterium]|nr:hypothetical protein [bacterium]
MTKWVCCLAFLVCVNQAIEGQDRPDVLVGEVLSAIGLTTADLSLRGDYLLDPDRLPITRALLESPLDARQIVDGLGLNVEAISSVVGLNMGIRYLGWGEGETGRQNREPIPLPGLSEPLRLVLAPLVWELAICRMRIETEFGLCVGQDRNRLTGLLSVVDPERQLSEWGVDSLLGIARAVGKEPFAEGAKQVLVARDRFLRQVVLLPEGVFPNTPITISTLAGQVVVGSLGNDRYENYAALIVDPGGNDVYVGVGGVTSASVPVSLCLDLAGADVYTGAQGLGLMGVGIVTDLAGNDRYQADRAGQGSGLLGVGILEDRGGDDVYHGGLGVQGFGLFGIGLLVEYGGNDRYEADLLGQGAAGPGGIGLLFEVSGDDVYEAGGRYRDFRESGAYFQSMSQGFGLGIRPIASGGLGVLVDAEGGDTYRVGYFGQGGSHWAGTGILLDRSGDDFYEARRYAQGCGSHLAVGLLFDEAGDDAYLLWGVGQGCGHDLSLGCLFDRSGNDRYRATWLAQGAGHANGIGWLDDGEGADQYQAERGDTQGFGSSSRDYGSLGLLIDRGGADLYSGQKHEGRLWEKGDSGVGLDAPLKPTH